MADIGKPVQDFWGRRTSIQKIGLVAGFAFIGLGISSYVGDGSQTTTTTPASKASTCPNATLKVVKNIESGLTHGGSLRGAKSLTLPAGERNTQGWPQVLVAAKLHGQLSLWATSVNNADDAIWGINDPARRYTDWGSAAQPGSPARDAMDTLLDSATALALAECFP